MWMGRTGIEPVRPSHWFVLTEAKRPVGTVRDIPLTRRINPHRKESATGRVTKRQAV